MTFARIPTFVEIYSAHNRKVVYHFRINTEKISNYISFFFVIYTIQKLIQYV